MTPSEFALSINRTPRCVQMWCAAGLIGRRIGGRWEIDEGTKPPEIPTTRKTGRIKRAARLTNFKRKVLMEA